ncbi:DUF6668 family protein [Arthrobacter cavernae]|uniref:Uncharacterized protein n=1 Tax=Arthrobacter cavernae TaxID=2817681 RepID=A0A939HKI3_9MICC|nr:DUF6668 family protein [Arthrobacter cavernae]MBO1269501.1 hypothetical protein [Arthrobacter cavernae]
MNQSLNPWITSPATGTETEASAMEPRRPPAATITGPLRGMVEPDAADRLGHRPVTGTATVWVAGVHGGAGESRLAGILDGARPTEHAWPVPNRDQDQDHGRPAVVLVCRSDMRGLKAAQSALIQWASGAAPDVELLGLAVLADAPGKLPKALREFAVLVGGGAPRLWLLPWVESWRLGDTGAGPPAREYQRFATDLAALTN